MDVTSGAKPQDPQESAYDCVLVEDDELVQLTWRLAAEHAGVRLLTLPGAEAALRQTADLTRHTPIYIDVRLHGSISGEQLAYRLHRAGFSNLFLQTGYDADSIPVQAMPWLKGVVGKAPPWPLS